FMLSANFGFYASFTEQANPTNQPKRWDEFDFGTEDGYEYFLSHLTLKKITGQLTEKQRELLMPTINHTSYDEFWQSRNIATHLK
ncbi:X-Pro dipeptidyl-peptidase, partial [Undibacterium sp. CCC3.4]|nr:X-Pro dipeptidyl-peptidase [Undibacterium sp. CCC3.4]